MEDQSIQNARDPEEISIKQMFLKLKEWNSYILSKWLLILLGGILGVILGFTYAYYKKPIYSATTTFVLEEADKGSSLGQYAGLASMAGIDISGGGGGIFQGDNILELYKSRTMIEKALFSDIPNSTEKQLLIDRYISFNNLRERWSKDSKLKNIQFPKSIAEHNGSGDISVTRRCDSIVTTIVNDINKNNLNVSKPDKKLNIIQATVIATDEIFAKGFNEALVKNVNDFYLQTKTKKSAYNVSIMQHKADSVRAVMNGEIYQAAIVTDATPNLNITRQVQRVAPLQRSQFNAETNKAMLSELLKSLELSKISLLKETPLIQVIDRPLFPLEKQMTGKIKWAIIGGFLAVLILTMALVFRKIFKALVA
jgi:hypothetical protein